MNSYIEEKLKQLPKEPGVYFHKDKQGEIIYVGKAAKLNNRVRQYFHKNNNRDPKTSALVEEIYDIDWMVVDSELEALFLEAEMVRRYMPRYNILLRDDKSLSYIRIDYGSEYPTVDITRRPLDDGARYFGPYFSAHSVRQALKYLRRIFPFATKKVIGQKRASLHYHLGLDPGLEESRTTLKEYRKNLRQLIAVIEGKKDHVINQLEKDMKSASKENNFEVAAKKRNQMFALKKLNQQVIFSDKEFLDISKDHALNEMVEIFGLKTYPKRIEGYDISHMQGTNVVSSMVVFSNGVSNKSEYRKFKIYKDKNNDFANIYETIFRRFSDKYCTQWGIPDFVIIDGGKGQLESAIRAREERKINVPFIGLAKREEEIVVQRSDPLISISNETINKLGGYINQTNDYLVISLPKNTNIIKLLQRIRDESHRFAVSYHSTLKRSQQTSSILEDIPGVGPATRKKLIKAFGGTRGLKNASEKEIADIIGSSKAKVVYKYLN